MKLTRKCRALLRTRCGCERELDVAYPPNRVIYLTLKPRPSVAWYAHEDIPEPRAPKPEPAREFHLRDLTFDDFFKTHVALYVEE